MTLFLIPALTRSDALAVLPLTLGLVGFLAFWFVFHNDGPKAWFHRRFSHDDACLWHVFTVKTWGFLTMGIVPGLVMASALDWGWGDLGLRWPEEHNGAIWQWTIGLGVAVSAVAWLGARKFDPQYPQIQAREWTKGMMGWNWLGWALYLAGYEFLFRGVLLFPLVEALGAWPAVAVNTVLYSATHVPKGREEAIGAIPLGFLLCWVTLETQSLWPAILSHVAMAWTNTTVRFYRHPEMKWKTH